jgi:hypothetical protein
MIAAPAAALVKLGEVIEPLLGDRTPAGENVLGAPGLISLCHEKVRKVENGRKTQRNESTESSQDILWKTCAMSSDAHAEVDYRQKNLRQPAARPDFSDQAQFAYGKALPRFPRITRSSS